MKEKISILYKLLILVVCGIGIYMNVNFTHTFKILMYFTIISNIMCFLFYFFGFVLKALGKLNKNKLYYIIKGTVTMSITVTMFVFWTMVIFDMMPELYKGHMMECRFVHLYTPILIMLDYVLFGEKGNLEPSYPFFWSFCLLMYGIFVYVYSSFGGTFIGGAKYPYDYLDIENMGIFKVIVINTILYVLFLGYGTIVQKIDNFIATRKVK